MDNTMHAFTREEIAMLADRDKCLVSGLLLPAKRFSGQCSRWLDSSSYRNHGTLVNEAVKQADSN